ncbi:hypothetical protein ACWDUN_14980 [Mycobacterium sp. NPDC003323]
MRRNGTRIGVGLVAGAGLLLVQLATAAIGQAEEPVCPAGTYWNPAVVKCLPYGVNPVVGPVGPVGVGGVVGPVGVGPVGPGPVGPGGLGPR